MQYIQIFVKTLNGSLITLDILNDDTICNIKELVNDKTGIPPQVFTLMYGGKNLDERYNIKHYGIQKESTLTIGMRLLSSTNNISLKLPNNGHVYTVNDTETSFCSKTTLKDIIKRNKLSSDIQIMHNGAILENTNIKIIDIPNIYNSPILHTKTGKLLNEANLIQFKIINNNRCIRVSSLKKMQKGYDINNRIDKIIHKYLEIARFAPQFYDKYCIYKAINVQYKRHKISLKLKVASTKYVELFDLMTQKKHGIIPDDYSLISLSEVFCLFCDCCKSKIYDYHKKIDDAEVISDYIDKYKANHPIIIEIVLSEISFFFKDKYYINGEFYEKYSYDEMKNRINFQFYPLLRKPRTLNKELLVFGFVQSYCYDILPMDIMNLIKLFYPKLYGVTYTVDEYNPNLNDKFEQKTDIFQIGDDGIECYLKYGGYDDEEEGFHLVFMFKHDSYIKSATILYQIYCKLTKQSYSDIYTVDDIPMIGIDSMISLPVIECDIESTLQSLICNIQILKLNVNNDKIYEYPLEQKQNSYLLEWIIDYELLKLFKKCIDKKCFGCFESIIFYEMFMLRIYPNGFNDHEGHLIVSIQLIALPIHQTFNELIKNQEYHLKAQCKIYETETNQCCDSYPSFTYSTPTRNLKFMKSEKIKNEKKLKFRVEIYNLHFGFKNKNDD